MGLAFSGSSTPPGGGGAGTVTSLTTSSQSLHNASVPNPITNTGNIDFEVQIIDGTYVQIALLELGGALLEGVMYRITDFNHVIGNGITLLTATFMTVKGTTSNTILASEGNAYSAAGKYEISYRLDLDFIYKLYFPDLDQRCVRSLGGSSNNIETLLWESTPDQGFDDDDSFFTNTFAISAPFMFKTISRFNFIDCGGFKGSIEDCSLFETNLIFSAAGHLRKSIAKPNSTINISGIVTNYTFEANSSFVQLSGTLNGGRIGSGDTIGALATSETNKTLETAMNELQTFDCIDGGSATIADSIATHIFISLNPDAAPPVLTFTITLPANPIDGQVFHFGSVEAMAGVTIDPGGHSIQSNIPAIAKFQCFAYYWDAGTGTFYLV